MRGRAINVGFFSPILGYITHIYYINRLPWTVSLNRTRVELTKYVQMYLYNIYTCVPAIWHYSAATATAAVVVCCCRTVLLFHFVIILLLFRFLCTSNSIVFDLVVEKRFPRQHAKLYIILHIDILAKLL